jgi:hypothetical protein
MVGYMCTSDVMSCLHDVLIPFFSGWQANLVPSVSYLIMYEIFADH